MYHETLFNNYFIFVIGWSEIKTRRMSPYVTFLNLCRSALGLNQVEVKFHSTFQGSESNSDT